MTTPIYLLAERPDGTFAAEAAKTDGVTLRASWADWHAGNKAPAKAYLDLLPKGTKILPVLDPCPAPGDIQSITVAGVQAGVMFLPACWQAFGQDELSFCAWVASEGFEVVGTSLVFSTMAPNDDEQCFAGAHDPVAVAAWVAAGYRPSLVNDAIHGLAALLYAGGITYMRLPILDPRTGTLPIAEDGSILDKPDLQVPDGWFDAALAGVGGAQGVIAPYDLNLGEHGLSTFVQEVANKTGVAGGQLHANLTVGQIKAGVAEADRQALAMLECHQGALPGG